MATADRLIIAIDFGTTYTGVAFLYGNNKDHIEVIQDWSGSQGATAAKCPSVFTYRLTPDETPDSEAAGENAQGLFAVSRPARKKREPVRWGYDVEVSESKIEYLKLFLDRSQKLPSFVSKMSISAELLEKKRPIQDALADFLQVVHKHAMSVIRTRYMANTLKDTPTEYVMTVPAVWSDAAKHAMLLAAERTDIGKKVKLLSEPEAAAIYTMHAIYPNQLEAGNTIIVYDAGGGTVDLIAYKITQIDPLAIEESTVGTGDLCGAAFLNQRFRDHVKQRLGGEAFDSISVQAWNHCMERFENYVKRDAHNPTSKQIVLPGVADIPEKGIEGGFMTMTRENIDDIFEPLVTRILALLDDQIHKILEHGFTVTAILLVGGFGTSQYLHHSLTQKINDTNRPENSSIFVKREPIQVLQPPHSWTAVVRGAVMHCMSEDGYVTQRRSRHHYGSRCDMYFDSRIHPADSRYFDEFDEKDRAAGAVTWFINKGQNVANSRTESLEFCRCFKEADFMKEGEMTYYETLIFSDEEEVGHMFEERYKDVCRLEVDLSKVPKRRYDKGITSDGSVFYQLNFFLDMAIESATLSFALRVGQKTYGTVKADFEWD